MARCTCLARHPKTKFALRVIYTSLSIAVGVIAGVVFGVHFGNRDAAIWALLSAVFSCFSLAQFIYLYVVREVQHRTFNRWVLLSFGMLGSVVMAVGFGAFISYLGLGIMDSINHTSPHPLFKTHYITCVWTFATFRAGLTPYLYSIFSFKYCPGIKREMVPVKLSEVNDHFR